MKTQKFTIDFPNGYKAEVKVTIKGWLRKKREVEYFLELPGGLRREAYSMLTEHIAEKLKKRPFEFHLHLPSP